MGGSQTLVFGISHFLPGGGAGPDASPPEKIYHILDGELTVIAGGKETVLKQRRHACFIAPNENREIVNRGNERVHDRWWRSPRRRRSDGPLAPVITGLDPVISGRIAVPR